MPHVGTLNGLWSRCGKSKYLLGLLRESTPDFMLPALCGIFMIVSIETGGPRIALDPCFGAIYASVVTTSDAQLQLIGS